MNVKDYEKSLEKNAVTFSFFELATLLGESGYTKFQ
ncbi:MAG: hypothetical protein Athens071425_596 [Parcubacteria group bacterium Athens0714_25]|nr:MAG: hypothetical protein Athens071425_596 [Parcubacteria group bacterium Athens0714_25]